MDAEKRLERVMDRLFAHRSSSSPSTPAASSAGRSALPSNPGGSGNKKKLGLELQGRYHLPNNVVSMSSSANPKCRPWDRGDLFQRLATFKSMSWFGKPNVVGPISCARRGWVNVDMDMIACEGCGAHLSFPVPASWSKQQVESAAEDFAKKLETGHKSFCPWIDNECAEGLAQFPPTPVDVLVQGYNDRCEALLQLSALPLISVSAMENMKLSKGPQLDRLLAHSQPVGTGYLCGNLEKEPGAERAQELQKADSAYHQVRKLISLCGWELRLLPYSVDYDDTFSKSSEKVSLDCLAQSRKALGPNVYVSLKGGSPQPVPFLVNSHFTWDPSAALLDCKFCGANVGLWNFTNMVNASPAICSTPAEQPEYNIRDSDTPVSRSHAVSGSDAWSGGESSEKGKDEAPEVTKTHEHSPYPKGVLDLSLTIAGGPSPTQLIYSSVSTTLIPIPGLQSMCRQLESSQMGNWLTSQRFGDPQEHGRGLGGESSIGRQNSGQQQVDSLNGIVMETDGDVTDVAMSGMDTSDFRKRKLNEDTSAVNQTSQDLAVEKEMTAFAGLQGFQGNNFNKRKRQESLHVDSNIQAPSFKDTPVSSSVNAVHTYCNTKMSNSAESVQYIPDRSDGLEMEVGGKRNEVLARFGAGLQTNNHRNNEVVEPGLSISDEGGGLNNTAGVNSCINTVHNGNARNSERALEEVNRNETSFTHAPSTDADAEYPSDVVNRKIQTSESGIDWTLTGESAPRKVNSLLADTHEDSNEAFVSLSPGHIDASVKAKSRQGECEELHVQKQENEDRVEEDCTNGTIIGLFVSGETGTVEQADAEGPQKSTDLDGCIGKYFAVSSKAVNKMEDAYFVWNKESDTFDPVLQHRHFCPWVSTNASDASLCGWQSTLQALDALKTKVHMSGEMAYLESTASKFKGNPLQSVRSLLGGSSLSKNNASC